MTFEDVLEKCPAGGVLLKSSRIEEQEEDAFFRAVDEVAGVSKVLCGGSLDEPGSDFAAVDLRSLGSGIAVDERGSVIVAGGF